MKQPGFPIRVHQIGGRLGGVLCGGGEIEVVIQLKEVPTDRAKGNDSLHIPAVVNTDEKSGIRTREGIGGRMDRLKGRDEYIGLAQADGLAERGL